MEEAKVIKSTGRWYNVELENGELHTVGIRGKIRLKGIRTTNPVSVGDRVLVDFKDRDTGVITKILPRKNYIIRKSINLSKESHILAANIDRVYLLVTLVAPETHLTFVDRFLVTAEAYGVPATLLFNKMDLYMEEHLPLVEETMDIYRNVGYECVGVSALDSSSIDFLKEEIKGRQVMFAGNSGTGKSTLINALDPSLNIKTSDISITHLQGQHTTTFAEMHKLESGGYVIDTPGIRAFGVVDMDKNVISHYFPEMRELLNQCKFHNCLHLNEPECAVKEAVENGKIHPSRYRTYYELMNEDSGETYR
ncbi:MAG: ribosome small subunit-dependent GTPase A [Brumimicrobium sp.]